MSKDFYELGTKVRFKQGADDHAGCVGTIVSIDKEDTEERFAGCAATYKVDVSGEPHWWAYNRDIEPAEVSEGGHEFSIGDRVTLSKSSGFYNWGNNHDDSVKGTVRRIDNIIWPVYVEWDGRHKDHYMHSDLEPAGDPTEEYVALRCAYKRRSLEDATADAEVMAKENPGETYVVFKAVAEVAAQEPAVTFKNL